MSGIVVALLTVVVIAACLDIYTLDRRTDDLRRRVACLEHPWQASSTSMTIVAGRRVQGPVTRTDCLHPR